MKRLLNCPETLYKCRFNSLRQRHSADLVRKSRKTHSLSSRFADVLSLECNQQHLSSPGTVDRSLTCATPMTVVTRAVQLPAIDSTPATCAGFDLMQTITTGSSLILTSPSLRQLSFADDGSGLIVAGSRCSSSMNVDLSLSRQQSGLIRTPGDFPSNLLLAPVAAPNRQFQQHSSDPQRVSGTVTVVLLFLLLLLFLLRMH